MPQTFPTIHSIATPKDKSIQIFFRHQADSHSFTNALRVIVHLLKLQDKQGKDEFENWYGFDFQPYDPKISAILKNLPNKPLTPSPKCAPLTFSPPMISPIEELGNMKHQSNQGYPKHPSKIKMVLSNIPPTVQQSHPISVGNNQINNRNHQKKIDTMPEQTPFRSFQPTKIKPQPNPSIKSTQKKGTQKNSKIDISTPYNMKHVGGIIKGSQDTETYDVDHAIKELLKVARLKEEVLGTQNVRRKLEVFCRENNLVSTFQNYRVVSNCFDGSIRLTPVENNLKRVKSKNSIINTLDGVTSVTSLKEISGSHLNNNDHMATLLHREDNVPAESFRQTSITEPTLKELIIEAPASSTTESPSQVLGNIQARFSYDTPIENSHVEWGSDDEWYTIIELREKHEDTQTSRFSASSIISFKLKPTTEFNNQSTIEKNQMIEIDPALNEALSVIRVCKGISFDYDNEDICYVDSSFEMNSFSMNCR